MLDLPDHPVLDKRALLGGCVRLPLRIDVERLRAEVEALPQARWGTSGGRIGVHRAAEAIFLRGHAPAEGEQPIADRDVLTALPYARRIFTELVPAPPLRCLLARLPGGAIVPPHVDRAPYFAKCLRLHVPVATHARAWMICDGLAYQFAAGEAWVLDNCAVHAVWNEDPLRPRTHLICDFLPTPPLLARIAAGERGLGRRMPHVEARFVPTARTA